MLRGPKNQTPTNRNGSSSWHSVRHGMRSHAHRRLVLGIEKSPQRTGNRLRFFPMREVTAVLEADQLAVLQQSSDGGTLGYGENGVARSPEEAHRWKLVDFRDPVEEISGLAPPADDVAHGAREGAGAAGLAQVGRQQGDLGPGITGGGARYCEGGDRGHPALTESLDQERYGSELEPREDLPPQTTRGQQSQASNPGAAFQEQPLSNPATVRVSNNIEIPQVEPLDEARDLSRVPVECVGSVGPARHPVTWKIQHQNAPTRQPRPDLAPGAV